MQKNCDLDYTLKSRKSVFGQLFFSLFSTLIFFGFYVFFQFFFMYFITSKIIFSKFGMYLTYKNRFWGLGSGHQLNRLDPDRVQNQKTSDGI